MILTAIGLSVSPLSLVSKSNWNEKIGSDKGVQTVLFCKNTT